MMNLQTTSMTCSMQNSEGSPTCPAASTKQGRPLDHQVHHLSADTVYKMAESARLRSASLSRRCAVQQLLRPESRALRPSPVIQLSPQIRQVSQSVRHHSAMLSPCSAPELPPHIHTISRSLERPLTTASSGPLETPALQDQGEEFCSGDISSPGYVRRVEITARRLPRGDVSNCDGSCCLALCSHKPAPSDQRSWSNTKYTNETPSRASVAHHFRDVIKGSRVWQEGSQTCSQDRGQDPELSSFPGHDFREKSFLTSTTVSRLVPKETHVRVRHTFPQEDMASTGVIVTRQEPKVISDEVSSPCWYIDTNDCREERAAPSGGERDASMPGAWLEVNSPAYPNVVDLRGEPSTPLFFCSLKHMNSKIYLGMATRSLASAKVGERRLTSTATAGDGLFPAFVSPRKSSLVEKPQCKGFFGPPLLAKDRQIANPSFFAGSDVPYSLPERLPDVLEFTDRTTSVTDPTPTFFRSSSGFFPSRGTRGARPVSM